MKQTIDLTVTARSIWKNFAPVSSLKLSAAAQRRAGFYT